MCIRRLESVTWSVRSQQVPGRSSKPAYCAATRWSTIWLIHFNAWTILLILNCQHLKLWVMTSPNFAHTFRLTRHHTAPHDIINVSERLTSRFLYIIDITNSVIFIKRPHGLVVWFLLWVLISYRQEAPRSNRGGARFFLSFFIPPPH